MKTLLKSGLVLALGLLLHTGTARAQGYAPAWGPPAPPTVQYYYLPEIDGYYDLYSRSYLFFDPAYGAWVSSPVLPRAYAGYDPRFFHPVVIQYVGRQPWGYLRDHRAYCDRWGVRPGRYYGSNWPGHGYAVAPRPGYGPAYYNDRPGNYARNEYRDNRNGYDGRGNDGDERRDNNRYNSDERRDDNRSGRSDAPGNGRPDDRSNPNDRNNGRNDRSGYTPINGQAGPNGNQSFLGTSGSGRRR